MGKLSLQALGPRGTLRNCRKIVRLKWGVKVVSRGTCGFKACWRRLLRMGINAFSLVGLEGDLLKMCS